MEEGISFTQKVLILNLKTSTYQSTGADEKWLDFNKNLTKDPSKIRYSYWIKGYENKLLLLHRKDKGNLLHFTYAYCIDNEKEINQIIKKGLLEKLHPDTKRAITIN